MGNIILLDENTINKIAAGEVVDRPSSIVKELVENSIDANAKNITVEIKNGGISYIKINDDGDGFRSDDVEIAFERHATSKIRQEVDILKITSMGFRGEALASVAAISKVSLSTRHKDEEVGTKIVVEAGNIITKERIAFNKGTTIYIKDVFYNTPARFKFLKKDYTESGYIEDVIIRMSLSNPHISFKYINNGKTIISTSGDNKLESVIYTIFGKDIYSNILNVDYSYKDIVVTGVVGLPQISRSTRNNEFTYINKRFVKDKILKSSIEKAYTEKLGINKFPFAIINLKINTETIDVNVHPAKLEVKFENEKDVFEAVYFAIKNVLENNDRKHSPFTIVSEEEVQIKNEYNQIFKYNTMNFGSNEEIIKENTDENNSENNSEKIENNIISLVIDHEKINQIKENIVSEYLPETKELYIKDEIQMYKNDELIYIYIGQVFNTYIIIQIRDKMYIIDQHAAHERLLYEKFKENFYSKTKETQMLMIPILIELKNNECEFVFNNVEYFENCGFILESFSNNSYKISGVPNIADLDIDYKSMFLDIIDELRGSNKTEYKNKEFRFLATLACKAAVKGNMKLTKEENIKLVDEMLKLENPFTCPHGRPTAYEISKYEIEKKFGRK
ncbi:MAG: DNA mismatch repair endonuclease MutL [Clostridia bacterium]|nr:DNA mismatch repair endonuclease MutL [Clostridia bacterium]MDD4386205.1 DNA mismatch repair endonuclease MutL [Clostridia bacterium]